MTTPGKVFDSASRALFGDLYVAPMAHFLSRDKNLIGKWRNDKTPIPAEIWSWITTALALRRKEIDGVHLEVNEMLEAAKKAQIYNYVIRRSVEDQLIGTLGLVEFSRVVSEIISQFDMKAPGSWPGATLRYDDAGFVVSAARPINSSMIEDIEKRIQGSLGEIAVAQARHNAGST
ncbi:MAG: hypothetical protein WCK95_25065 [Alphaproteobacteria bacterium]